jgi:hypothetical protein
MNTAMLNGAQPFCSDTKAQQGHPLHLASMVAGEAAVQGPLQAAVAAHPHTPLGTAAQTAPAAVAQAACTGGA